MKIFVHGHGVAVLDPHGDLVDDTYEELSQNIEKKMLFILIQEIQNTRIVFNLMENGEKSTNASNY